MTIFPPAAHALTQAELLTPELERRPIMLAGLSEGVLSYFDADRRLTSRPTADFVRMDLRHETPPDVLPRETLDLESGDDDKQGLMRVELVDGQRLVGRWAGVARDGEAVVWEHAMLGRFTLPLDMLRSVTRLDAADGDDMAEMMVGNDATPEVTGDRVRLLNGDALVGFLLSVSAQGVTLQRDGAAEAIDLPLAGIASIELANPPSVPGLDGDLVALRDGSRVRAARLRVRGDRVELWPSLGASDTATVLDLGQLIRIDFAASGARLVELMDQPMRQERVAEPFDLAWPATTGGGAIRLHAPTVVRFDLPAGARRLVARVELDLPGDLPPQRAGWASLTLRINGEEPGITLDAEHPRATLNTPLDPQRDTLTLELDTAAFGPVLDRLRLREALLLIDAPVDRPGSGE